MGMYIYVKTTTLALIDWQDYRGGIHEGEVAAVTIYAYKPYSDWGPGGKRANREMSRSNVWPWRTAWKIQGQPIPSLFITGERISLITGGKAVKAYPANESQYVRRSSGLTVRDDSDAWAKPVGDLILIRAVDRNPVAIEKVRDPWGKYRHKEHERRG